MGIAGTAERPPPRRTVHVVLLVAYELRSGEVVDPAEVRKTALSQLPGALDLSVGDDESLYVGRLVHARLAHPHEAVANTTR